MATVDFPIEGLSLEVSPGDSDRIVLRHHKHPGWTVYTYDFDILDERYLVGKTALRQQIRNITVQEYSWRKLIWITLSVFGVFMLLALILFLAAGWTVDYLVSKVPTTYEKEMGNSILKEMEDELVFIKDTNAVRQIEQLAMRFIPESEQKRFAFKFYIIESEDPNAMALPGGNILVTSGLLGLLETPEELASVLAHETAHVSERHGLKHIVSRTGPYLLLRAFLRNDTGFLGAIGHGSGFLISQNFSQKYETEADAVGWEYLKRSDINPQGAITALRKLQQGHIELDMRIVKALASHPPTADRIRRLEGKWTKLKKKTGYTELKEPNLKLWK